MLQVTVAGRLIQIRLVIGKSNNGDFSDEAAGMFEYAWSNVEMLLGHDNPLRSCFH